MVDVNRDGAVLESEVTLWVLGCGFVASVAVVDGALVLDPVDVNRCVCGFVLRVRRMYPTRIMRQATTMMTCVSTGMRVLSANSQGAVGSSTVSTESAMPRKFL